MKSFVQRHASSIEGALSGFDRIRFRGTVRLLASVSGMRAFLSHWGVLLKDFSRFCETTTEQLCQGVAKVADRAERPIQYLPSSQSSKEEIVERIARKHGPGTAGIVAVLSCVEPCQSYVCYRNRDERKLELRSLARKCLHHYVYSDDPMFGRVQVRLQSWFPFNVHIVINGREWLSRQMDSAGIGYLRKDNCFAHVDDYQRAQRLLDRQVGINWPRHLDRLLHQANPALRDLFPGFPLHRYWSADQTEWATDVAFRNTAELNRLYPKLIDHSMRFFGSRDVMRFLGRKVPAVGGCHGNFAGEIVSDLARRPEGLRVKHRVNRNAVKMYNKQGSVLRVETTINDARDLKVKRSKQADPQGKKSLRRLRKGVVDLPERAQLSQAANERYLEALAAVEGTTPMKSFTKKLCHPVTYRKRRMRALNPYSTDDARLLAALLQGEFTLSGFRNRDLRAILFGPEPTDASLRRKQSAHISRKLVLLKAHGLIQKVRGTHNYILTKFGIQATTALHAANNASTKELTSRAA